MAGSGFSRIGRNQYYILLAFLTPIVDCFSRVNPQHNARSVALTINNLWTSLSDQVHHAAASHPPMVHIDRSCLAYTSANALEAMGRFVGMPMTSI